MKIWQELHQELCDSGGSKVNFFDVEFYTNTGYAPGTVGQTMALEDSTVTLDRCTFENKNPLHLACEMCGQERNMNFL